MPSQEASGAAPTVLPSPLRHPAIERIWIAAAAAIGWRVERSTAAYASSDGRGSIAIGIDDILDADDAVAQLVFHELCHGGGLALVRARDVFVRTRSRGGCARCVPRLRSTPRQ